MQGKIDITSSHVHEVKKEKSRDVPGCNLIQCLPREIYYGLRYASANKQVFTIFGKVIET